MTQPLPPMRGRVLSRWDRDAIEALALPLDLAALRGIPFGASFTTGPNSCTLAIYPKETR